MLEVGSTAPDFTAQDQHGATHSLGDYAGRTVILYFYPKDMTPGCTVEACDFRDNNERIVRAGAVVLGVSPDSVKRHAKFAANESLNFPLLADPERKIIDDYGVWKEKTTFGRTYMGVERTTFVIGPDGTIVRIFPQVTVPGHVEEVLDAIGA